jgi:hypothetical protein
MMSELVAKPVVKNKYWIVENDGHPIATIQAVEDGGFVYVHDDQRERYPSVKVLSKQHNIKFTTTTKKVKASADNQVYGFPISGKSFNEVYDVKRRLPIYTKTEKSKSQYCAGYYLIHLNDAWTRSFCPKSISVNRYPYLGPFATEQAMLEKMKEVNNATT